MTDEFDKERMHDALQPYRDRGLSEKQAKQQLILDGRYNKGTEKALRLIYNRLVLKNGKSVLRTKKGQIQVRDNRGKVLHNRGNQYAINRFLKVIEGKKKENAK